MGNNEDISNNNNIKISVIVPVYNVEKFVEECVQSIINQTLTDIEIILINDNSKDNSNEICKELLKKDSRISLYQSEGKGVSKARNIGISVAKGEWISFVDSDDWLEENMMEELYNVACKGKSDIIMCDSYINKGEEQTINEFYYEEKIIAGKEKEELQIQAVVPIEGHYKPQGIPCGVPWAKLYNKEFILKNNLKYKTNLPRRQDMIFNLEAFEKTNEINYIQKKLYHYRKNEGSKVNRFEPNVCYEYNNILTELENFMNEYNKNELLNKSYKKIVMEYYRAYKKFYFHNQNKKTTDEKLEIYDQNLNKKEYKKILKEFPKNRKLKFLCFLFEKKLKLLLNVVSFYIRIKNIK